MGPRNIDCFLGTFLALQGINFKDVPLTLFLFPSPISSKKTVVRFGRLVEILTGSFMALAADLVQQADPLF